MNVNLTYLNKDLIQFLSFYLNHFVKEKKKNF